MSKPSIALRLWLLLLLTSTAAAQVPKIEFEKYTLPNGLQVILHEDHGTPIVGVNVWYHVGSKNERPGRTGFAHLFEHMMFQGSKHYDKDYFLPLQQAGGRLNGSTNSDRTNYWETVPSNYLELALWMESDRMAFLLPAMTQEWLDNQRSVVKNERRQSYENRPYGLVHETLLAAMYPPDHPYSWPTIGSMADVDAAARADVADFFRRYYHPGNASLCIAGDFEPAEAKRLVAKYFAPIPAGPKVEKLKAAVPELKESPRIRMTDRVGLARLYLSWHTVPDFAADDAALEVLGHILAGDKTARLYRRLVRDMQIAQQVGASQIGREIAGDFTITVTARPGQKLAELEAVVREELARIQAEPPTAEEVARALAQREAQLVRALESVSGFGGRADRLNRYNVLTGDPGFLERDFARFAKVDPAAVQRVAKQYLGRAHVALEVVPGDEPKIEPDPRPPAAAARDVLAKKTKESPVPETPLPAEDADRVALPKARPEPKFQLPPIHRSRLSNGMELLVVEKREMPVVNIHVVFPFGRSAEEGAKLGLAGLMAAVWDEGTQTRSAEQIAEELGNMGASLSVWADADQTGVRLYCLKRHLGKALGVYADVLQHPSFPAAELERQRKMALGRLLQVRNEPLALASLAVGEALYGYEHPYGRPQSGTPSSLRSITRDDIVHFHQAQVRPEQAAVIAVGDISVREITEQLEKALGGWKSGGATERRKFPPLPAAKPAAVWLVDKPGAAQSIISVALVGAERNSPDYFALAVMNTALGGQFASRLNMNLREDKGYTYGARSHFEWHVYQPGPFVAGASVQTAVTAPALGEFLKELEGMLGKRPVGEEELDFCKKYITRGYPAGFETPGAVAAELETLVRFNLPDDYCNTVVPKVSAVSADDVLRVARKYLDLDRLAVIVVGDRSRIEAGLRELPIGKNLAVWQFDEDFRLAPANMPDGPRPLRADDWPQWRGPTRDGAWKETGVLEKFPGSRLEPRWRAAVGSGYSGPTVADGRVFLTDRQHEAKPVERVLSFDWKTGQNLWIYAYDCPYREVGYPAGPRAAVSIDDGRAYALGTMGHLHCLSAADGALLWKKDPAELKVRVPVWGVAAAPLVDGELLIVQIGGADGACLMAFDKKTGVEKWRALADNASYSAPIIIPQAGRRVLVCWTGDNVVGLDPASGKVYWKHPFRPARMVINVPTPVVEGDRLFLSAFYDGSLMLRLRQDELGVEQLWRRRGQSEVVTDALHAMISTPLLAGDCVYGVDSYGQLRCLDARNGDRLWEDLTAVPKARWATIHMVRNGGRIWMFNERGEVIISELSPKGFHEISRAKLLEPTTEQLAQRNGVCWSHPAYAYKHIFARNDRELVCASLAAE
jgi:zinc protease